MYKVVILTGQDQIDPYVLYNLFCEAVRESVYQGLIPINEELLKGTALHYSEGNFDDRCLVLLMCDDEYVGFLCGEVGYMSRYFQTEPIASETLWWVRPDHRKSGKAKEMVEVFETWAKYAGCTFITMSNQANEMMDRVGKFYVDSGYTKLEESYMKKVNV